MNVLGAELLRNVCIHYHRALIFSKGRELENSTVQISINTLMIRICLNLLYSFLIRIDRLTVVEVSNCVIHLLSKYITSELIFFFYILSYFFVWRQRQSSTKRNEAMRKIVHSFDEYRMMELRAEILSISRSNDS
jgi:hypothetical protein